MHIYTGGAVVEGVAGGARFLASLLLDAFEPRIGGRTFREREREGERQGQRNQTFHIFEPLSPPSVRTPRL